MVFPSSVSAYLDPSNWQQQQQQQQQAAAHSLNQNGIGNNQQAVFQQPDGGNYGGGGGTIAKPNSMAERARQAKIPQPESALKCPRCESTNTKFCYFNNYSLTQPRHFCKTCRRYWTRGGALRSVPVGGGCRRNKRSKSGGSGGGRARSSSSSAAAGRSKSPSNKTGAASSSSDHHLLGRGLFPNTHHDHNINLGQLLAPHHQLSSSHHGQLPLLPPLHHLGQLADYNNNNNNNAAVAAGGNIVEQWRLQQQQEQQFPFFANLEHPPPLSATGMLYSSSITHHDQDINQGATEQAKMEGNSNLLMSRNFLGNFSSPPAIGDQHDDDDQQQRYCSSWGGKYMNSNSMWSGSNGASAGDGLPGFTSSSSTSHLL